jgi:hypothetical protein
MIDHRPLKWAVLLSFFSLAAVTLGEPPGSPRSGGGGLSGGAGLYGGRAVPRRGSVRRAGRAVRKCRLRTTSHAQHIGPQTTVVRLDGKAVLPGLIDTHLHWRDDIRAAVAGRRAHQRPRSEQSDDGGGRAADEALRGRRTEDPPERDAPHLDRVREWASRGSGCSATV